MTISQWIIAHFLEIVGYLLAIVLIPRILLERRHPGATIAWILAIGLIPFVGVPVYFLIGGKRIKKISREKERDICRANRAPACPLDLRLSPDNRRIANLLMQAGRFPPAPDNRVTILDDGVAAYATLMRLLETAEHSIEVATFILGRDEVGRSLVEILARKAAEGVRVRLLLDAVGCLKTRGDFVRPVRDAGGRVGVFLPIMPLRRPWSANLRNHRKMTIIDGRKALIGGMNLAREYMGPDPHPARWKDVNLLMEGSAAGHVRNVFWEDWVYTTGESIPPGDFFHVPPAGDGPSTVQVVGDGPDIPERPLYAGILAALNRAGKRIWVVTPYFVPDDPLSAALQLAARLGCDVRLVMPERSNHPLVDLAGRSYLPDLLEAGIRFHMYQPGMLHAKMIAIDGRIAVVGTANMDVRSFQLNFEIATFLYEPEDVGQVERAIGAIMADCRELSPREIHRKSRLRRFSEDICRVFSPLF